MISNPLVSIIIPVFNVEYYLTEALDSVINQTYEKLEILIIDDGSTDGSDVVCDEYAKNDERINVIHQENMGLSAARNTGLRKMTGELCAFIDPDDAYEKTFIEKLLAVMIREDADLVVCRYTNCKTEGTLRLKNKIAMPSGMTGIYDRAHSLRALADGAINVNVWNKLYRSELWKVIHFPDGYVYEDLDTMFRVFNLCNKIAVFDEPLYLHRQRQDSITTTYSMKNIQDENLACSHFADFIELHIPEIYTEAQVKKWRQYPLKWMISSYINCSKKNDCKNFRKKLRNQIVITGKETGFETLSSRLQIAWYMISFCPWLFTIICTFYRPVRLMIYKIVGR